MINPLAVMAGICAAASIISFVLYYAKVRLYIPNLSRFINFIKTYLIAFILSGVILLLTNFLFALMVFVMVFSVQYLNRTSNKNKRYLLILEEYATYAQLLVNTLRTGRSLEQSLLDVGISNFKYIRDDIKDICVAVENYKIDNIAKLGDKYNSHKVKLFYTALYVRLQSPGDALDNVFSDISINILDYIKRIRMVNSERSKSQSTVRILIFIICGTFLGALLYKSFTRFYYTPIGVVCLIIIVGLILGIILWMARMIRGEES